LVAVLASVALLPPAIGSADPGAHVDFRLAKSQLYHFAYMTCPIPGSCRSRVHDCRRLSSKRVDCPSESLVFDRATVVEGGEEHLTNEICSWIGSATPYHGSSTRYRLDALHFRCRPTDRRTLPPLR